MLYALLGRLVWKGAKLFLRRRYGRTYAPKPLLGVLAGVLVALAVLVLRQRR